MSFNLDDANVGGQLKVGSAIVPAIGEGATRVNGSMYSEGPIVMGNPTTFPIPYATVNTVSYTHLRAHETRGNLVCRLLLEKKNFACFST